MVHAFIPIAFHPNKDESLGQFRHTLLHSAATDIRKRVLDPIHDVQHEIKRIDSIIDDERYELPFPCIAKYIAVEAEKTNNGISLVDAARRIYERDDSVEFRKYLNELTTQLQQKYLYSPVEYEKRVASISKSIRKKTDRWSQSSDEFLKVSYEPREIALSSCITGALALGYYFVTKMPVPTWLATIAKLVPGKIEFSDPILNPKLSLLFMSRVTQSTKQR